MKLSAIIVFFLMKTLSSQRLFSYSNIKIETSNSSGVSWKKLINSVDGKEMIGLTSDNSIIKTGSLQGQILYKTNTTIDDILVYDWITYALVTQRCIFFLQRIDKFLIKEGLGPCDNRAQMPGVMRSILNQTAQQYIFTPTMLPWNPDTECAGLNLNLGTVEDSVLLVKITSMDFSKHMIMEILFNYLYVKICRGHAAVCALDKGPDTPQKKLWKFYLAVPNEAVTWYAENQTTMVIVLQEPKAGHYIHLMFQPLKIKVAGLQVEGIDNSLRISLLKTAKENDWMAFWNPGSSETHLPLIQGYVIDPREKSNYIVMQTTSSYFALVYIHMQTHWMTSVQKSWGIVPPERVGGRLVSAVFYYDNHLYFNLYPNHLGRVSVRNLHDVDTEAKWNWRNTSTYIHLEIVKSSPYGNNLASANFPTGQEVGYKTVYMFDGFLLSMTPYQDGCRKFIINDISENQYETIRFSANPDLTVELCVPEKIKEVVGVDVNKRVLFASSENLTVYLLKFNADIPTPTGLIFEPANQQLVWSQELVDESINVASYCIHCKPACEKVIASDRSPVKLLHNGLLPNVKYELTVQGRAENGIYTRQSFPIIVNVVEIPQPQKVGFNRVDFRIYWLQNYLKVTLGWFELECHPICSMGKPPMPYRLPFPRKPDASGVAWMTYTLTDFGFDDFFTPYNVTVIAVTTDGRKSLPSEAVPVIIRKYVVVEKADYYLSDLHEVQVFYKIKAGKEYTYPRSLLLEYAPYVNVERTLHPPLTDDSVTITVELETRLLPHTSYNFMLKLFDIRGVAILELHKKLQLDLAEKDDKASKMSARLTSSGQQKYHEMIVITLAISMVAILNYPSDIGYCIQGTVPTDS